DGRAGRRDAGGARRHADRVLRPPPGPLQAPAGPAAQRPARGRRGDHVRAHPPDRLRGARAGRLRGPGALVAVTALVLRALGLGDLLTAVPALRALRRAGMRVVLAAPEWLRDVAVLTDAVHRLHPTPDL